MAPKQPEQPSIRQSKEALLEAAQAAIADQRSRPQEPIFRDSPPPRRGILPIVMGALIAAGVAVLVLQPTWLTGPGLPVETERVKAASATLTLVDAVSKIQAFTTKQGRLPATLDEAGVENAAIGYKVVDETAYEVSLQTADSVVSIRSTDSLKARVVDAILTLQRRT